MQQPTSLFTMFGGIRPMARKLNEPASNVCAWKRVARIPAEKQPNVLAVGLSLGLPITPELVIFPLGDVPEQIARDLCAVRTQHSPCGSALPPGGTVSHPAEVRGTRTERYGNSRAVLPAAGPQVPA